MRVTEKSNIQSWGESRKREAKVSGAGWNVKEVKDEMKKAVLSSK